MKTALLLFALALVGCAREERPAPPPETTHYAESEVGRLLVRDGDGAVFLRDRTGRVVTVRTQAIAIAKIEMGDRFAITAEQLAEFDARP